MSTPVRPTRSTSLRTAAAAAVVLATGLALTGCSSGGGGDSGGGGSVTMSDGSVEGSAPQPGADGGRSESSGGGAAEDQGKVAPGAVTTVDLAVSAQKLSRRGSIALTVEDVDAAAARVRSIAAAEKGMVLSESIASEPEDVVTGGFSTITVSVPTARLDAALDQLSKLGEVHSRTTATDDVTSQYVDTASRVETMKASVERVRSLMGRAERLADIVSLEAELSRRQADLEAVQSQLAALEGQVAMAPIEVRLSTDEKVLEEVEDDTGFLAGLVAGWEAFTGSVTVLLTGLGAVLPFAVALALVIGPLVLWLRRRGPRPSSVTPPPVAPAPPAA